MRPLLLAARLLPALGFCLLSQMAPAQTPATPAFPALPPGPGRDVMVSVCANCHTPEMAATQCHDKAGWRDVLQEMVGNGAQFTPVQGETIVNYLSTVFPEK